MNIKIILLQVKNKILSYMKPSLPYLVFLLGILCQLNCSAAQFLKGCIMPNDFGATELSVVLISPVGSSCMVSCESQCDEAFSYQNIYGQMSNDQIQACIKSCKSGISYTDYRKQASTNFPFWSTSSTQRTVAGCTMLASSPADGNYTFINTNVSLTAGQTFAIAANVSESSNNNIYLCGSRSIYMYPGSSANLYPVSRGGDYTAFISPTAVTASTYSTECSAINPDPYYCFADINSWSPVNKNWTMTNLAPKNGDSLSVYYFGNYYLTADYTSPSGNILIRPPIISLDAWGDATTNYSTTIPNTSDLASTSNYIFPGGNMGSCSSLDDTASSYDSTVGTDYQNCVSGSMNVRYTPFALFGNKANGKLPNNAVVDTQNIFNSFAFTGYLQNYSNTSTMLGLAHYESNGSAYSNNHSGFIVRADWQGCVYKNGERLQYTIQPSGTMPNENTTWEDIYVYTTSGNSTTTNIDENPIIAANTGTLYLRIKPLTNSEITAAAPTCASDSGVCQATKDIYYSFFSGTPGSYTSSPQHSGGKYQISISKAVVPPDTQLTSGLNNIVSGISNALFGRPGSGTSKGQVQVIFSNLIVNSGLVSAIRATLVFYIAFTALNFLLGTSKMNQREVMMILLKMGIISTLISSNSWDFFNTYLFSFIRLGTVDLISDIVVMGGATSSDGAAAIFDFLDAPLAQLFSTQVWLKILALIMSGLMGWVVAIFIMIASLIFIVIIFKTAMIYVTSLVMMSILSILSPVFLCFMLFKYTFDMFSGWLKMYISFALQPIFVIAMVSMMSKVIVFAFQNSLSFTACHFCLFGIGFTNDSYVCFLPWLITLKSLYVSGPGGLSAPIEAIQSVMLLYMLVQSTNALCTHMCQLASTIATGSAMSVNLASAGVFNPVSSGISHFNTMIGMNSQAKSGRANIAAAGKGVASMFKARPGVVPPNATPAGGNGSPAANAGSAPPAAPPGGNNPPRA